MTDLSASLFVLAVLLVVVLGTILAAVGFGYSRGYFNRRAQAQIFCVFCGTKLGWMRRTCGRCGAPVWNIPEFSSI